LNALGTLMLVITLIAVALAGLVLRLTRRRGDRTASIASLSA
jgi:divalent metal cation (Fe/Co/Zn/Cd) transporter